MSVNSTLFIMFARGLDGNLNSYLLTLSVTNLSSISYTSIYNASIADATNVTTSNDDSLLNSTDAARDSLLTD